MAQYLIEAPHTEEECLQAFEELLANRRGEELLNGTYSACNSGVHISWTIAEFASEDEARNVVSVPTLRNKLRVYPVEVFTPEQIKAAHAG